MENNKHINPNTISFTMNKNIIIIIVLALILVGFGFLGTQRGWFEKNTSPEVIAGADENLIVAYANGAMITVGELNRSILAVGGDINSLELRQQILTQMIAQKLFYQQAIATGLSISDEELQLAYASLVEQFGSEEMMSAQLDALGLSSAQVYEMLSEQVLVQKYTIALREEFQVTISDQDVAEAYTSLVAPGEDAPSLEEVSSEILQYLAEQEFEMHLLDILEQLQNELEVHIYLDNPIPREQMEMAS
jgi:hypothetical protein